MFGNFGGKVLCWTLPLCKMGKYFEPFQSGMAGSKESGIFLQNIRQTALKKTYTIL